jgi:hypothetical protein
MLAALSVAQRASVISLLPVQHGAGTRGTGGIHAGPAAFDWRHEHRPWFGETLVTHATEATVRHRHRAATGQDPAVLRSPRPASPA